MPRAVEEKVAVTHQAGKHSFRPREIREWKQCQATRDQLPQTHGHRRDAKDWAHLPHPFSKSGEEWMKRRTEHTKPEHHTKNQRIVMSRRNDVPFWHQEMDRERDAGSHWNS